MDGFLTDAHNDDYALGYYKKSDRPFHNSLASHFTVCDRYFCSFLGPTFPNRMFSHSAQTDRLSNTFVLSTLPTIWDSLAAAGVSATYYFSNLPFLGLWGPRYVPISRPYQQFLADAAAGTLPAVSFVDPKFTITDTGDGNDDHPHADIRAGDLFLAQTFSAVANGPLWPRTVFVVTYDEWGGFFDHVPPPRVAAANLVDPDIVRGKALLGFRIPVCVASPFSRSRQHENHGHHHADDDDSRVISSLFDHTSVLKLIEWRWRLAPLTLVILQTALRTLLMRLSSSIRTFQFRICRHHHLLLRLPACSRFHGPLGVRQPRTKKRMDRAAQLRPTGGLGSPALEVRTAPEK